MKLLKTIAAFVFVLSSLEFAAPVYASAASKVESGVYLTTGAAADLVLNDYSRGNHSISSFAQEKAVCSGINANFFGGGIALGIYSNRYERGVGQPSAEIVRRAIVRGDTSGLPAKFVLATNPAVSDMKLIDIDVANGFGEAEFAKIKDITFAVSGLRFINKGQVESSDVRPSTYTAFGWDASGQVMSMIFRGLNYQTIKSKAIAAGMVVGVGLDGGGSTQMFNSEGGFDTADPYRSATASTETIFVPIGGDGSRRDVPFYLGLRCGASVPPAPPTSPPNPPTNPPTNPPGTPPGSPPSGPNAESLNYNLNAGWNAVSFPGAVSEISENRATLFGLIDLFRSKGAKLKHLAYMNAGSYQTISVGAAGELYGRDAKLIESSGLLVFVEKQVELRLDIILSTEKSFELVKGWNLEGVGGSGIADAQALATALSARRLKVVAVSKLESGNFQSYLITPTGSFGNNFKLNRKQSYFILID